MTAMPTQIGSYKIASEIGRGGMGVVYLALDTKLDRDVAIKCLPDDMAADKDRLTRFEREAKLLASLSHNNIAGVYGLEQKDGQHYLVMEYVEGEDLSERIDRGALPLDETLDIAIQIAHALEAAHDKGIVHRDLKPANIKITPDGEVKVLDFGLAKDTGSSASSIAQMANSPTVVGASPTMPGVILGTAGYLSPEQARGRKVDKRSDIFSFGCVLYEMLSGLPPFPGETATDSIGATLHKNVEFAHLPADTPPMVRHILTRCLERDRNKRLRDIGDARLELAAIGTTADALAQETASAPSLKRRLSVAAISVASTIIVAAASGSLVWAMTRPEPLAATSPTLARLTITAPSDHEIGEIEISGDGRMIAYIAEIEDESGTSVPQLFLRPLDAYKSTRVERSDRVKWARFSPNSRQIAFCTVEEGAQLGRIMTVPVHGGPTTVIGDELFPSFWYDADWESDDSLLLPHEHGLARITLDNPEPVLVVDLREHTNAGAVINVLMLEGSDSALVAVGYIGEEGLQGRIEAIDLNTGDHRVILDRAFEPLLARDGLIVFGRSDALLARRFDLATLTVQGEEITLESSMNNDYEIASTGTLISLLPVNRVSTLVLVDETGAIEPLPGAIEYENVDTPMVVRWSPDGNSLAMSVYAHEGARGRLYVQDIAQATAPRLLAADGAFISRVEWNPANQNIAYDAARSMSASRVFGRRSDGGNSPSIIVDNPNTGDGDTLCGFTPDGSTVVFMREVDGIQDLWVARDGTPPEPLQTTPSSEHGGQVSPDGRWVAFSSDQTGRDEVWIASVAPGSADRVLVSTTGGRRPCWSEDGNTIYYENGAGHLVATDCAAGENDLLPSIGSTTQLFSRTDKDLIGDYDINPIDGKFVMIHRENRGGQANELRVTIGWLAEVEKKLAQANEESP